MNVFLWFTPYVVGRWLICYLYLFGWPRLFTLPRRRRCCGRFDYSCYVDCCVTLRTLFTLYSAVTVPVSGYGCWLVPSRSTVDSGLLPARTAFTIWTLLPVTLIPDVYGYVPFYILRVYRCRGFTAPRLPHTLLAITTGICYPGCGAGLRCPTFCWTVPGRYDSGSVTVRLPARTLLNVDFTGFVVVELVPGPVDYCGRYGVGWLNVTGLSRPSLPYWLFGWLRFTFPLPVTLRIVAHATRWLHYGYLAYVDLVYVYGHG